MNEAVNKPDAARGESRLSRTSTYAPRSAQSMTTVKPVNIPTRAEIKSIPFTGLLTNKLLANLPGEDFARLLPFLEPVSLSQGDYIYGPDSEVEHCYLLETAVVSLIHLLEDGGTTEVAVVGNEGMIGISAIFGANAPSYWSEVLVTGSALRVHAEALREEFNRGKALQRVLLGYTSERLAHLSQRAVCNGRHALAGRICSWLLMIHDRVGGNRMVLTHEEMARHLGTRRASVSVVATQLKERGVIRYNRGKVYVVDRFMLEALACECYRALTRQAQVAQQGSKA